MANEDHEARPWPSRRLILTPAAAIATGLAFAATRPPLALRNTPPVPLLGKTADTSAAARPQNDRFGDSYIC